MRILYLALDVNLADNQGDAVHVRQAVKALAAVTQRIALITATPPDHVPLLGGSVRHYSRPEARDIAVLRFCVQVAREEEPDLVYERRLSPKVAYGVSRLTQVPFVVEVNGIEEEAGMMGRPPPRRWRPVRQWIRKRMYRRAAMVVAVSEGLAALTRRRYELRPESVVTVENGADTDMFTPVDSEQARRQCGLPEAAWIVFVGNLAPWQGVQTLIRAMPLVLGRHASARLVVVGDGLLRNALEAETRRLAIESQVVFVGAVPHNRIPWFIGAATVCAAPFTRERNEAIGLSPLKVYEYLACSRPVVASDISGVRETLRQSGGGLLVVPDDPQALGLAISEVLSDPIRGRAMGEGGRDYIVRERSWGLTAHRLVKALSETTRERPRAARR